MNDTANPIVNPTHSDEWFSGRRITLMGLGQFGGGLGVARWLLARGARVTITDLASDATLAPSLTPIADAVADGRVDLHLGSHDTRDFEGADLVVANAAVPRPWTNKYLCAARDAGVPVTTEIRLAIERLGTGRIVGITGSSGKSTTTAMTACALAGSGREVRCGGNIGGSLLGASPPSVREWIVLELSSAQLWWLSRDAGAAGWSPRVAALTNIAANHVDWHGSLEHYIESKRQIRREQREDGVFVTAFTRENRVESEAFARSTAGGGWWIGGNDPASLGMEEVALAIPGEHQQRNAQLALAIAATCADIDGEPANLSGARAALRSFQGLEHRLQAVGVVNGVRCFNDSKATTPQATHLALASLGNLSRIHLIAGGYDKKIDLSSIRDLAGKVAGLYAIGETARAIAPAPPALRFDSLAEAVASAFAHAKSGDTLLLSPSCASFDQFTNYEARGHAFIKLVRDRVAGSHC